jgi:hypothetical protein
MKLSKAWVLRLIFFSSLCILCLLGNIGSISTTATNDQLPIKIFLILFSGLFTIGFGYLAIYDFFLGHRYVEEYYIPIEDFSITHYDNGSVVIYKNYAWNVPVHHRATLLQDSIKATQYYNRKKKETGWSIDIPYLRKVA